MTVAPGTRVDADGDLVEALRREDPDAAERLVERFGDRVYRLAMRITGLNEDAEEYYSTLTLFQGQEFNASSWVSPRRLQFKVQLAF